MEDSGCLKTPTCDPNLNETLPSPHAAPAGHRSAAPDHVEETIQHLEYMLATTLAGAASDPQCHAELSNLGGIYAARYERTRDVKHLRQSILCGQQILSATPTDDVFLLPRSASLAEQCDELYHRTGDLDNLTQGITCTQDALESLSPGHHARVHWLVQLANRLDSKYRHGGAIVDLEAAILYLEEALHSTPDCSTVRPCYLNVMSNRLQRLYEYGGAAEKLRAAVSYGVDSVVATPAEHEHRTSHVLDLLTVLDLRYAETGTAEDLVEAIFYYRQEMAGIPANDPAKIKLFEGLFGHLSTLYTQTNVPDDLDQAIQLAREALAAVPQDHPVRVKFTHDLAHTLALRYALSTQMADLEESVSYATTVLELLGLQSPAAAKYANKLGRGLQLGYQRSNTLAELEAAIRFSTTALELCPRGQQTAENLDLVAGNLSLRFEHVGSLTDLHRAIELGEEAVAVSVAEGTQERLYYLGTQSVRLRRRYKLTGDAEDLETAIAYGVAAVEGDHPDRGYFMGDLVNALRARYERRGELIDLRRAIEYAEELWEVMPRGGANRLRAGLCLASGLELRYRITGDARDLERAVEFSLECVKETPQGDPLRAQCLDGLANSLFARFQHSLDRNIDDLQNAITHGEEAVACAEGTAAARAGYLKNQAFRLRCRYSYSGAMEDLQQAAILSEGALADPMSTAHHDILHHSCRLDGLAGSLADRFNRTGAVEDIQRAVTYARESLEAAPPGHLQRAARLMALAEDLRKMHHQEHGAGKSSAIKGLQDAIMYASEALELTPLNSPFLPRYFSNVSRMFWCLHEQTGGSEDMMQSILFEEEALLATEDTSPFKAMIHYDLAQKLFKRFEVTNSVEDVGQCLSHLRSAWNRSQSDSQDQVRVLVALLFDHASHAIRRVAEETLAMSLLPSPEEASSILEGAVLLLQRVGLRSMARDDQQHRVIQLVGLAERAASAAIEAGKPAYDALKLLELSRGIIMGLVIDCREDMSDLQKTQPALFSQYNILRAEIDRPLLEWDDIAQVDSLHTVDGIINHTQRQDRSHLREIRVRAASEMELTIEKIRTLPGFERFQLPPSPQQFMAMAAHGPIVIFVSNCCRSDAIIITATAINSMPLPKLHNNEISNWLDRIQGLTVGKHSHSSDTKFVGR